MTINTLYSLTCTDCSTSFYEPGVGSWTFEDKEEVINLAKSNGWNIAEEVPNGSEWDFCPKCISRRA